MREIALRNKHDLTDHAPDEWTKAYLFWLGEEIESRNTRAAYHTAWEQFRKFTDYLHYGAVTAEDVGRWKVALRKTSEPTTVNLKLSAISSFYRFVNTRYAYLRDDNPAEAVKQLTVKSYGKATLLVDNQDIELLASIDRSTFEGLRDYTIILLFLTTGVRLAALAEATVANVRRQGAIVYFSYTGKRNKAQNKRLPNNAARVLLEYMGNLGEWAGSLFGLSRHQIQYMLIKRCNAVFGVGHGITIHSLRHTAANNASKNGSIQDVRSLLDHESTRVTAVYLDHVTNDQGEKMSDLLDTRYG